MSGFDQYYDEAVEPGKRERAYAWATAIGLQDVDGLKPSKYLIATAKRHIEGEISQEEARRIVDELKNRFLRIGFEYGSKGAVAVANLHREKLDIEYEKPDIDGLSQQTKANIKKLLSAYSTRPFFKRKDVLAILALSPTAASDLLAKMLAHGIISPVKGHGKGAYRFNVRMFECSNV